MDELTRTGTDEGGPQHGTGLPVDGQLGLTVGVAVQKGSSGGRGVADLSSDDVLAGGAGPLFGQAAGGELGGAVKTTCGTGTFSGIGSGSQPAARAVILSPTTRAPGTCPCGSAGPRRWRR